MVSVGTTHRLENPGRVAREMIAAHSGSHLGEDDIVRFEDVYGRQGHAAWLRQGTSMQNSEARKALHESLRKVFSIQALSPAPLPINISGEARIQLAKLKESTVTTITVRDKANDFNGFSAFTMGGSRFSLEQICQCPAIGHNT